MEIGKWWRKLPGGVGAGGTGLLFTPEVDPEEN
jgi:hypothetical protein